MFVLASVDELSYQANLEGYIPLINVSPTANDHAVQAGGVGNESPSLTKQHEGVGYESPSHNTSPSHDTRHKGVGNESPSHDSDCSPNSFYPSPTAKDHEVQTECVGYESPSLSKQHEGVGPNAKDHEVQTEGVGYESPFLTKQHKGVGYESPSRDSTGPSNSSYASPTAKDRNHLLSPSSMKV